MVSVTKIRYLAAGVALLVAGIHLLHPQFGFPRLVLYLWVGTLFDPRPPVFTASAIAIIAGVLLVFNGVWKRRVYLAGIALTLTFLLGYVVWHTALDHGAFWPHIVSPGHSDVGIVRNVLDHLLYDTVALFSKTAETTLLVLLVYLLREDTA